MNSIKFSPLQMSHYYNILDAYARLVLQAIFKPNFM